MHLAKHHKVFVFMGTSISNLPKKSVFFVLFIKLFLGAFYVLNGRKKWRVARKVLGRDRGAGSAKDLSNGNQTPVHVLTTRLLAPTIWCFIIYLFIETLLTKSFNVE